MERYDVNMLKGTRTEARPKHPACWVVIQRLQGVTSRRRSILLLCESGLKAYVFPLWVCQKLSTRRGFHKTTSAVSRVQESPYGKSWL